MAKDKLKLIGFLFLAGFIIIVSMQNRADVSVRILSLTVTMPRFLLLLTTALFGFITGVLFSLHFLGKSAHRESDHIDQP